MKRKDLTLVKIDSNYCNYLRQFDSKVCYNAGRKELRPFIGVLFNIDDLMYFAPLSSPKPKHLKLKSKPDLIKIDNGKLGVINLNNMIPVEEKNFQNIDLTKTYKTIKEKQYISLLKDQLRWLNRNKNNIYTKSINLYNKYVTNNLNNFIKERCCNFPLLEEKCKEYNK